MTAADALREAPVGLWTRALDALSVAEVGSISTAVESMGFSSLWFGETVGREPFLTASLVLAKTSRLVAGTAIANIWGRDPVAANAANRTLSAAFAGRFVMGLGVSHAGFVASRRRTSYERPVASMENYLRHLREAPYEVVDRDQYEPTVLVGALGPKMTKVAGDHADGTIPYLTTPSHVRSVRNILGPRALLVAEIPVVLAGHGVNVYDSARRHLAYYAVLPAYRSHLVRLGYTEEQLDAGDLLLLGDLFALGNTDDVQERVSQFLAAGADHVCLQVIGPERRSLTMREWEQLAVLTHQVR